MDVRNRVVENAVVYVESGVIAAVRPRGEKAPAGFEETPVVDTGGTLFPGLIELHNHLSYNALPLWSPVPKRFEHRGQWPDQKDYRRLISGPMTVIGKSPDVIPALIRYVECKCLLAGVTTSQGIRLNSNAGVQRYYRGVVRNVEQTDDPALPEAQSRIPDIDARSARSFRDRLAREQGHRCFLLHLSEGITATEHPDSPARRHFLALEVEPGKWAVNDALSGIHATGLLAADFGVLARNRASMVWSPMSNLLLYGGTSRVDAARAEGVKIGLGSDWSPSGSKNLLGELKVAHLYSEHFLRGRFTPRDLVAMATRNAAEILKWDQALGTLEPGKRADLLVIRGKKGDPYEALIRAIETDVMLVVINGVGRYGVPDLMKQLVPTDQTIRVGGESRRLFLKQETSDPAVGRVSLTQAKSALKDALAELPRLAQRLEKRTASRGMLPADRPGPVVWSLALDEISETGASLRPRLPFSGPADFTGPRRLSPTPAAAAILLSKLLGPLRLDPLTVIDDPRFLPGLESQANLPPEIRRDLPGLYR
jgi:hypothetical protein